MYGLIRQIHGYSGLILIFYTGLFFASGIVMMHPGRFPGGDAPGPTTSTVAIDVRGLSDSSALIDRLRTELRIRGRASSTRLDDGGWEVQFSRPGRLTEVSVPASLDAAQVTVSPRGWKATLSGLHRIHGYGGGPAYAIWAVFYNLVSLAMIGFPLSGIYLWYRRTTDHRLGWALLTTSCLLALGVAWSMSTMP